MVQSLSSSELVRRAMSAAMLRQTLLSNNLANADTPGYKRFDLDLRQAIAAGEDKPLQKYIHRQNGTEVRADGNNVDIEQEMAMLAENSLYYQTLAQSMISRNATLRYLINEGRR